MSSDAPSSGAVSPRGTDAVSERVRRLVEAMSLEEKVGQMTQLTIGAVAADDSPARGRLRLDPDRLREAVADRHVGSLINILGGSLSAVGWRDLLEEIQAAAAATRLGIPILYGIDHVHGANYVQGGTIFPHAIGLAATFDPELVGRVGEVTGRETLAAGLPWNFAPVLDVGRQPLWPRFYETLGESPWLAGELGAAMIRGLERAGVASTAKHFLAYSGPTTGRDRTPAPIGRRAVHEQFLPPFRRAVAAGVKAVMVNSGEIDGEPVHASRYWLTQVLREELGFRGVVVTDWADITFLHTRHRVAATLKEATRRAVEAGIDMAMTPDSYDFHDALVELVRDGAIPETRIDGSVTRILTLKEELGLFDRPVPDRAAPAGAGAGARVGAGARPDPGPAVALEAARASMTLLRNDGVLPLRPESRVLVTGPAAASLPALTGGWTHTWQGTDVSEFEPDAETLLDALARQAARVEHLEGSGFLEAGDIEAAAAAAARADVAVVALGETAYAEWVGDIRDLSLPHPQLRLAEAVIDTGTPTVLVLLQGRPRLVRRIADRAGAVLLAYWPGLAGARAIAETLYGDVNPSGRLPFTYPRYANDLTLHDHKYTETLDTRLEPRGTGGFHPQFELGAGLAYTTFAYEAMDVDRTDVGTGEQLSVRIRVRNTGPRAGSHTVLLFTRRHYSAWTPHVRRLRGVARIELEPGGSGDVTIALRSEDLTSVDRRGARVLESGAVDLLVGDRTTTIHVRGHA